jgi:hypothetical protein
MNWLMILSSVDRVAVLPGYCSQQSYRRAARWGSGSWQRQGLFSFSLPYPDFLWDLSVGCRERFNGGGGGVKWPDREADFYCLGAECEELYFHVIYTHTHTHTHTHSGSDFLYSADTREKMGV